MRIKWLKILVVLGLILALSACLPPKDTEVKSDTDAQQSVQDDDQGDHVDADQDAEDNDDAAEDTDDDAAMDEETTEEESAPAPPAIDAAQIYAGNCAGCHGDKRQGGGGPPLLPGQLTKEAPDYAKIISDGVSGTPMKAWKDKLSEEAITALSEWILTPVE